MHDAQERYWTLSEQQNSTLQAVTNAHAALMAACDEYRATKRDLDQLAAEHDGMSFRAFRPEHIDAAFSDAVEHWEL